MNNDFTNNVAYQGRKTKQALAPVHQFSIHLPGTKSFASANLEPKALHSEMNEGEAEGGME